MKKELTREKTLEKKSLRLSERCRQNLIVRQKQHSLGECVREVANSISIALF